MMYLSTFSLDRFYKDHRILPLPLKAKGTDRAKRESPGHPHCCSLTLTGAEGSTGRDDPSSSLRDGRGHVHKHAQLRGALQSIASLPIDRGILA